MKVLAITADFDLQKLGGAESHFFEVSKRLAKKAELILFQFARYPHIPNFYGLMYILFATPAAIWQALKLRPDIIWATLDFPQAQVGVLVKIATGIPLYITSQNPKLGEEELVGFGGNLVKYFVSFAFHQAASVAAVSTYSAILAKELGAKKVIVIPNGVDLKKFKSQNSKVKIASQKLKIVTTSSLIPRNGLDILIHACKQLKVPWQLTIAGSGPEERVLKKLASGLQIKFLGRVENTKIPQLLQKNNLFVRPSRFEGFGSSFIEAMAAGLPVVGTPVGGITDFLKDNQTGFLVPVDDSAALAKEIEYLYSRPKIAKRVARGGQKFVKENYNWDKIALKVLKEFKSVVNER